MQVGLKGEAKKKPKRKNARFKMLKRRFKESGQTKIRTLVDVSLKEIQVKLFDLFTLHCNPRNYQLVFLQRLRCGKKFIYNQINSQFFCTVSSHLLGFL